MDRRRKISWKIAGKLMDPPDAEGHTFWIVELHTIGNFKGYRNPIVQFIGGTIASPDLDPADKVPPALPLYRYTVEMTFKELGKQRRIDVTVLRVFDAEGRLCTPRSKQGKFALAPWLEQGTNWDIQKGIWQTLISGNVRDQVSIYEEIWQSAVPYLLEMSRMPEMIKMENLYQSAVEHEELHTDTSGYDESKSMKRIKEDGRDFARFTAQLRQLIRGARIDLTETNPGEIWLDLSDLQNEAILIYDNGTISFLVARMELNFRVPERTATVGPEEDDDSEDVPSDQIKRLNFSVCYNFRFIAKTFPGLAGYPVIEKILALMTEYYGAVEHSELHTDISGYDEGVSLADLMAKDAKSLNEALTRPLLRMPPPTVLKAKRPVEHSELHTDTSDSEYDA